MGSGEDRFDDTVTVDFIAVAVVKRERLKGSVRTAYTNLRCDNCQEWWIMLGLDQKKVYCPWCGAKCKTKVRA